MLFAVWGLGRVDSSTWTWEVHWPDHHCGGLQRVARAFPVVPLDPVEAIRVLALLVVDPIQVGRTTCVKPPALNMRKQMVVMKKHRSSYSSRDARGAELLCVYYSSVYILQGIFYSLLFHISLLFVAAFNAQSGAACSLWHINILHATYCYYYRRLLLCCFTKATVREAAPLEARSGATTVQLLAEHTQCVTLLIAGGVVAFLLGECHSHTILHRVLMGVSLWYKKNLSWEKKKKKERKARGLRVFQRLLAHLADPRYRRRQTSGSRVTFKGTEEDP